MNILYVDCYSGMAGDMWLGALMDLGAPIEAADEALGSLGINGLRIEAAKTTVAGIKATKINVVSPPSPTDGRSWREIKTLIEAAKMNDPAKSLSILVFERLAMAEAQVHGCPIDQVHFHEVGAHDSIADIVGTCALYLSLSIDACYCSPIPVPQGVTETAHGLMPLPAPATAELLKGIPTVASKSHREIITPTGAALTVSLATEYMPWPDMTVSDIGYGAGSMELPWPNLLRLVAGTMTSKIDTGMVCMETNIDDMDPRIYSTLIESLFSAGAVDAWLSTIIMKKGRPAITVHALAPTDKKEDCLTALLSESSSLGVRIYPCTRSVLPRKIIEIDTRLGQARFKLSGDAYTGKLSVEYNDAREIAKKLGRPLIGVIKELEAEGLRFLNKEKTDYNSSHR